MFKEYQYIKDLGYDKSPKPWEYKIIDDDFEEIGVAVVVGFGIGVASAVTNTYSKRNLPVAPNLIRAMLWYRSTSNVSLDYQVFWNKQYNLRWPEVEQEIKKYLLFS